MEAKHLGCYRKKPDVSFFRVFGCKCYIYKKRQHLGKFQRRCDIGFLVDYSSKSKAYQVFNHAIGLVEETYDVEFDKSNGSQGAHENLDDVGDEPLREAMKNIPVGDIKPKDDEDDIQVIDPPSSSSLKMMSMIGELTFFLGFQVKQMREGIFIS